MQTQAIILSGGPVATRSGVAGEPLLRAGAELVARLIEAPPGGGRGTISLAGLLVEAELPPGLEAGQRLRMTVSRVDRSQVVLKLLAEPQSPARGAESTGRDTHAAARLAGELAVRGDGTLLQAAVELAGPVLPLPGGGAAEILVEPDGGDDAGGRGGESAEAAFVLHSPALGAIEVRLRSSPAGVRAAVTTAPGRPAELARAGIDQLVSGLERATGKPAAATVGARPPGVAAPPTPAGMVDERA